MKKLIWTIAAAIIVIVVFGTIYAAVQQAQRSDANYPQIQSAADTKVSLDDGYDAELVVYGKADIAKSLAEFTIVYDKKGTVVTGSGFLDNKVPKAPMGILTAAKGQEYHAVTWEPKDGVRIAAVTVAAKDYYVLSGRSLREVEKNETRTMQIALIGALVSLLLLGVATVLHTVLRQYT